METLIGLGIIAGFFIVLGIIGSIIENWDAIVEFFISLLLFAIAIAIAGAILFAIGDEFGAGGVIITVIGSIVIFYVGLWFNHLYQMWEINNKRKTKEKKLKEFNERKLKENIKVKYLKETNINDLIEIHNEGEILDTSILLILIKNGLDINNQDIDGQTALHKLLQTNQTKSIIILLYQGARLDIKNKNNKTPMDVATPKMKEYFSPFQLIMRDEMELFWKMNQNGMDINLKNSFDQTALHALALKDLTFKYYSNSLKNLIDEGMNIDSMDKKGRTPLFYAVIKSNKISVENLLQYAPIVDIKDKEEKTLLDYAKIYENEELIPLLKKHSKKYKKRFWIVWISIIVLIASLFIGLIKFPNQIKNSLLNYSIKNGYAKMIDISLNYGAKVPKINPIDMITNNENINTIKYQLSNQNINLNEQDKNGKTILHHAYGYSKLKIIEGLIHIGANKSIKDKDGRKPCFYGIYNANKDVVSCYNKKEDNQ